MNLNEEEMAEAKRKQQLAMIAATSMRMIERELAANGIRDGRPVSLEMRAHLIAMNPEGHNFGPETVAAVKKRYPNVLKRVSESIAAANPADHRQAAE